MFICSKEFSGNQCQDERTTLHIQLNVTSINTVRAAAVQIYDFDVLYMIMSLVYQQVYNKLPTAIRYVHSQTRAPVLGLLKYHEDVGCG